MGLGLYLNTKKCVTCGHNEEVFHLNYTYNVSPMWRKAIGKEERMVQIDDLTGEDSIPILNKAIESMLKNPEFFIEMNPKNGWGSYETFLDFLQLALEAAKKNPTAIWESCR
jgi:AAA+ superfamily predicted ATPase